MGGLDDEILAAIRVYHQAEGHHLPSLKLPDSVISVDSHSSSNSEELVGFRRTLFVNSRISEVA